MGHFLRPLQSLYELGILPVGSQHPLANARSMSPAKSPPWRRRPWRLLIRGPAADCTLLFGVHILWCCSSCRLESQKRTLDVDCLLAPGKPEIPTSAEVKQAATSTTLLLAISQSHSRHIQKHVHPWAPASDTCVEGEAHGRGPCKALSSTNEPRSLGSV